MTYLTNTTNTSIANAGMVPAIDASGNWVLVPIRDIVPLIDKITDKIGTDAATRILKEELVEQKCREEDEELNRLWQEYKTLAKLKSNYDDIHGMLNE